jgi:hypothetical protein
MNTQQIETAFEDERCFVLQTAGTDSTWYMTQQGTLTRSPEKALVAQKGQLIPIRNKFKGPLLLIKRFKENV